MIQTMDGSVIQTTDGSLDDDDGRMNRWMKTTDGSTDELTQNNKMHTKNERFLTQRRKTDLSER